MSRASKEIESNNPYHAKTSASASLTSDGTHCSDGATRHRELGGKRKLVVAVALSLVGLTFAANTAASSTPPSITGGTVTIHIPPRPQTSADRVVQNDDDEDDEEVYVALDGDGNGKADNKDGDRQPDHYVRVLVKFVKHCGIPVVLCAVENVQAPLAFICALRAGWNCAAPYDDR